MSGKDHLNPAQFGDQQDSDETEEEYKTRVRNASREESKLRHPSKKQPPPEDRS